MNTSLSCLIFSSVFLSVLSNQMNITLTTKRGKIMGVRMDPNPATNISYDAFIGIPYAEQPIRFQLAVARKNWTGTLVTQSDGPVCPQASTTTFSEDCLYLNVLSPKGASSTPGLLPVIAYIYGSAFSWGSSDSKTFGPDFLIPSGVILVTMNYRIGSIGFLTLGSKVAPGNLGLHDTLLALQWIQDEISSFGGDPTQVTLFGESAGAVMTQFHYLSSISQGMFRWAIADSGSALAEWAVVDASEARRRALELAAALGCDVTMADTAVLICLQGANISDIISNQIVSLPTDSTVNGNSLPWIPVLDSSEMAEVPFFNDSLDTLMAEALARGRPLLTGFNTDEGILKFLPSETYWMYAESNLSAFIPDARGRTMGVAAKTELVKEISDRYFPNKPDSDKVESLVKIYTDFMFAYPSIKMTRYFANLTYAYLFAYEGAWAPTPSYFTKYKLRGVSHGDELNYLFYKSGGVQYLETCPSNQLNLDVRDKMVGWWISFVKTGVPGSDWLTVAQNGYLVINSTDYLMNVSNFESVYYNFFAGISAQSGASTLSLTALSLSLLAVGFFLSCFRASFS